ncbi:hypothetical protein CC1G_08191 [Coprinopsis cinerea okayama7|uniref:F-box domain-containing protein n=1 Tax=Coprinopsis cinerea (strain Okayama-7 / 130 / ATCC MYA-4618 / FGSC 9003) TaxID=240176 RepID=A8P7B4_COPC7|nr:hypothetical protein CC1G_08191 [Coprinopsis cinerea okayama7\|eukprot:XP_001839324.1 hypothetical protein CC1G_08191 [Coprinopsis cinerea okayama7\
MDQNPSSHLLALPVELVALIVSDAGQLDPLKLLRITHISRRFRDMMGSTPTFWNRIDATIDYDARLSFDKVLNSISHAIQYSGTLPLNLTLTLKNDIDVSNDELPRLARLLFANGHRWTKIHIVFAYEVPNSIIPHALIQHLDRLRSRGGGTTPFTSLTAVEVTALGSHYGVGFPRARALSRLFPNLRELSWVNRGSYASAYSFPSELSSPKLEKLTLEGHFLSAMRFLDSDVLARLPVLKDLTIVSSGFYFDCAPRSPTLIEVHASLESVVVCAPDVGLSLVQSRVDALSEFCPSLRAVEIVLIAQN